MDKKRVEKRRENRKKQTAEDFTPSELVNQMLDKLPEEMWQPDKTFCDPACGNGNMLVEVLKRKIAKGINPTQSLQTLYGVDIMADNIQECRKRLLKVLYDHGTQIKIEHVKIVFNQIVWTCQERFPDGALEYDFSFLNKASLKDMQPWLDQINNSPEDFFGGEKQEEEKIPVAEIYDMFTWNEEL